MTWLYALLNSKIKELYDLAFNKIIDLSINKLIESLEVETTGYIRKNKKF